MSEKALGQLLGQRDKWFCSRWFQAFNRSTTDDKINEDDFIAALDALVGKEAKPKAELLMRVFDEDGDGVLNPDEFREALDHTVRTFFSLSFARSLAAPCEIGWNELTWNREVWPSIHRRQNGIHQVTWIRRM